MNLPFIVIFFSLLITNQTYWTLFNDTLSQYLGFSMNFVFLILGFLGAISAILLFFFGKGIKNISFLHKPYVLGISVSIQVMMTIIMGVVLGIEQRIDFGYLYFTLGRTLSLLVYLSISILSIAILLVVIFGTMQLLNLQKKTDSSHKKDSYIKNSHKGEDKPSKITKEAISKFNPKYVSSLVFISGLAGLGIFMSILFFYPKTHGYWMNILDIFSKYVDWKNPGVILSLIGIFIMLIKNLASLKRRKSPVSGKNRSSNRSPLKNLLLIPSLIFIGGLLWTIISVEKRLYPDLNGLSFFVALFFILGLLLVNTPKVFSLVQNLFESWNQRKKSKLKPKSTKKNKEKKDKKKTISKRNRGLGIRDSEFSLNKLQNSKYIRVLFVSFLILLPFWISLFQPLVTGAPRVDISFTTSIEEANDMPVPIQNEMVYPSFEQQANKTRKYSDLGGTWKYKKGDGANIHTLSPRNEKFLPKITNGEHLPDYNDSNWEKIDLPASYNSYEEDEHYWGVVWYRKSVEIPESYEGMNIFLKFLGANYFTDLWIDGDYVGYHEVGFTSFAFDVSNYLEPGIHSICLRIDTPKFDGIFIDKMIPDHGDFFNYGGPFREFYLEAQPSSTIIRADMNQKSIETSDSSQGAVSLDLNVVFKTNQTFSSQPISSPLSYTVGIYPLTFPDEQSLLSRETWNYANYENPLHEGSEIVLNPDNDENLCWLENADNYLSHKLHLDLTNVNFWSTNNPNLYAVIVNLTSSESGETIDEFCTQTGFRDIEIDGVKLKLNGADLKLAGLSMHEQYPAPTSRSLNDTQRYTDLSLIQDTGANWWRGSYPFHPMTYIYSDRLGLSCWEESPVFWANEIDFVQGMARDAYESLWTEVVFRDYNRPSILIWGGCNEPWAQENLYEYLQLSKDYLDKYDQNRLLSFACVSGHPWNKGFEYLDICTPNTYGGVFDGVKGDYYGEISKQLEEFAHTNPGKPMISMEWGKWRSSDTNDQIRCFEEGFQAFDEHPNCIGMTWWLAFDYYGRDYYNTMGIYNMERNWSSPTFDVMRDHYLNYTKNNL